MTRPSPRLGAGAHPDAGRLPALRPEDLDTAARALYDQIVGGRRGADAQHFRLRRGDGSLTGPFNVMLHAPGVGRALAALGEALRSESSLKARHREVAILTLAAVRGADYEWYVHERVARTVGLSDDDIAGLRALADHDQSDPPSAPLLVDPTDDLVRRVVASLARGRGLDADLYAEATRRLGSRALVELVVLAGYYDLLATTLGAFAIGVPEGERPFTRHDTTETKEPPPR